MKRIISLLCIVVMLGVMIPADILPVVAQDNEDTNGLKQVLTSCDTVDETSNIDEKVPGTNYTTLGKPYSKNAAYIQEGKASLTTTINLDTSKNSTLYNIFLHEARDVRGYKYFSCQLYLPQDAFNNLKAGDGVAALGIALSPEIGDSNKNALHFYLAKSELKEGWNEIKLPFAQAEVIRNGNTDYGTYNGAAIRYIRIFQFGGLENISITTYLDDVCVLNENQGLLIGDCDQKKAPGATLLTGTLDNEYDRYNVDNAYATIIENANSSITTDKFMEGTGALKAKCFKHSGGSYRMLTSVTLSEAATLDVSRRVETDVLHMWLYIGNWSYLQGDIYIDLTSSGDAKDNGVKWTIKKDDLQTGWNEIVKPLSSGTLFGENSIDWSNVNYIRVYTTQAATDTTYQKEDAYMLLDDIRIAEKEVFAQRKEKGTATPGGAAEPTLDGYEFGGYYNRYNSETQVFSSPLKTTRDATADTPVYIRWVPKEVMAVKAQVRQTEYNDCKKVLTSCDSLDGVSNIISTMQNPSNSEETFKTSGTVSKVRVKEGEASLYNKVTINTTKNETLYNIFLKDAVDVRGYKYFSCMLYLSNLDDLSDDDKALGIVLNSVYGESNTNALHFYLKKTDLQVGWNELKLPFAQANQIANSSSTDQYNGEAINYIRILQYRDANKAKGTLITYLDDISVQNDNAGVLIADCDQIQSPNPKKASVDDKRAVFNIINCFTTVLPQKSSHSIITDNKTEGTGTLKAAGFLNKENDWRIVAPIGLSDANRLDISDYKNTGYLQFMLYINDKTNLSGKNFTVELKSNGDKDDAEINWSVSIDDLKINRWNVVQLPLSAYNPETQPKGYNVQEDSGNAFEWESLNFFRIYVTSKTDITTSHILIDDIRVVDTMQVATCDSKEELAANLTGTKNVKTDDVIQGQGAFVNEANTGKVQHQFRLKEPVNFEGFVNTNGCLHFWYYVEDPAYLGNDNLVVELSSKTADWDSHDKEYIIKRERLVKGWNEIYLYLNDDTDKSTGDMDWKSIQHIRIYCSAAFKQACTTKIDDISLVPGSKETVDIRFISTVESTGYSKVGFEIKQSRSEKPLVTETTNVYETLYVVGEDGVTDNITPTDISGTTESVYMQAATILNIPNRLWDATFEIVPYWVTQDGTTVHGEAKKYTVNQICSSGPKLLNMDYDTGIELEDYNRDLYGMNAFSDTSDIKNNDPGVFYISKEEDPVYGGWYYMYLSGNHKDTKDIKVKVMRSKDLYNWQDCGAIDGYSLQLYEDDWIDTECSAFWAPEVIRNPNDKKYYMYFTAIAKIGHITGVSTESTDGTNNVNDELYMDRMFLGVAESDSPIGPFKTINDDDPTNGNKIPTMNFQAEYGTEEFIRALDASPFFDDDGTFYLYFVRHRGQYNDGNRICGVKMDDMAHATEGTFTYLAQPNYKTVKYVQGEPSAWVTQALVEAEYVSPTTKFEWVLNSAKKEKWLEAKVAELFTKDCIPSEMQDVSINEGPSIVKRNEKYYLTYSEDRYRSKDYSVHLAVSDDPLNGFVKLSSEEGGQVCYGALDEDLYGTGHHSLVENTDTNEWWIVYHRHATNGTYVTENGKELYDTSTGRYISVDRVNWITNKSGYEMPSTNGPLKALNWLPESVSGYANLAKTATITIFGATGEEFLKDEILPFYSFVADKTCVSDGNDLQITMRWDTPVTVSSLMIYNAHDVNAAFSKISDITFKVAEKPEWTTRAYEYARMTDIVFPERYWNAQTGTYVNCAPIVAEFDEITVTEITLTIRAEDYLLGQNQSNTGFNVSEIVVLGKNKY